MKTTFRAAPFVLSLWLLTACYTTYSGYYWVPEPEHGALAAATQAQDLPTQLEDALRPFGFQKGYLMGVRSKDQVFFTKSKGPAPCPACKLNGSDVSMSVVLDLSDPSWLVSISDTDHTKETEFAGAVRATIERVFKKYGVTLKFHRLIDWLTFT